MPSLSFNDNWIDDNLKLVIIQFFFYHIAIKVFHYFSY